MVLVNVLIPAFGRKTSLAIVLTSLLGQTFRDFDVTIADQTDEDRRFTDSLEIRMLADALRWHGHEVTILRNLPRRGMAQQRQFLLEQASAPYVHYLDDDVALEPRVMERMLDALRSEGCGFVGCPAVGLQYLEDVRPHQQEIAVWEGPVHPEPFTPETIPWDRAAINNAANALHLERRLAPNGETIRYHVAWVGGANLLFDRDKLLAVGGFSWWPRLPEVHAGEEVVVQFLMLRYFGGCGVLPAGTYHMCLPTTIEDRTRNATELFGDLIAELDPVLV
jgi:GT2 family glycosyltransferase